MQNKLVRIILDIVLIFMAFTVPWWLTFLFAIAAAFFIPLFFEFLIIGSILEVLYYGAYGQHVLISLALVAVLFLGIEYSKKHLIFYRYE